MADVALLAGSGPVTSPKRGSWADPEGPGRCRRCKQWLRAGDTAQWGVRLRPADIWQDVFMLCGDCTRSVMNIWGIRPSDRLFPS